MGIEPLVQVFAPQLSVVGRATNLVIGLIIVSMAATVLLKRREAAESVLRFYKRPADVELRWFERRPNPSPLQAMLMACVLALTAGGLGLVMIVVGLLG
jgi:hypothetical protein